jgi:hypothetical protein
MVLSLNTEQHPSFNLALHPFINKAGGSPDVQDWWSESLMLSEEHRHPHLALDTVYVCDTFMVTVPLFPTLL